MSGTKWYRKNRERIRAERNERYRTDLVFRQKKLANTRNYAARNDALIKGKKAIYRAKHREELAAKQLARYYANREEHQRKHAADRAKNRQRNRSIARQHSREVTERYAREQLSKYSSVSMKDWPAEVVAAKQITIRIKRELRTR